MPTVLIVDDDANVRRAVRSVFEDDEGFTVVGEAVNGVDAIAKTEEFSPDLVVLDLSMPVMNGLEAAEILKSRWPATPVFVLTAHGGPEVNRAAKTAGVDAVFSKSEHMDELLAEARARLLNNKKKRRRGRQ